MTERASQAGVVALANAICREAKAAKITDATRASFIGHRKAELARVHALLNFARDVPLVGTYIADLAAQKRLRSEMSAAARESNPGSPAGSSPLHRMHSSQAMADMEDAYKLSMKLRHDEKALGMSACIGQAPRPPIGG